MAGSSWFSRLLGTGDSAADTFKAGHTPAPPPVPLPSEGDIVEGDRRYRIHGPLGEGGYGSVLLAEPLDAPDLPDRVAVKLLSPRLAAETRRDTLRRELSSLLAVDHPCIPWVFDWSLDSDTPFVAMAWYRRGSLLDRLEADGMLPDGDLLQLLDDLLSALSAARRAGLLHLDVKPANVLVRDDGGFVLTDFGTSQAAWSEGAQSGPGLRGSRGYAAPEQGRGASGALDLRTDLYGVGATVWAAATGVDLASPRGLGLLSRHRDAPETLPSVRDLRPSVPATVAGLIDGLLARDPARRPADPATVRSRLRAFREDREAAVAGRGRPLEASEVDAVAEALLDPLWAQVVTSSAELDLTAFGDGAVLVEQGESSHHAFVLLQGRVRVLRDGAEIATVGREGGFLGEVAALTGGVRTASLHAAGPVVAMVLDLMGLERLVASNPAVGVRLVHTLAERMVDAVERT